MEKDGLLNPILLVTPLPISQNADDLQAGQGKHGAATCRTFGQGASSMVTSLVGQGPARVRLHPQHFLGSA